MTTAQVFTNGVQLGSPQPGSLYPFVGGNMVGPASSTDNAVARFDGTTGKLLQDSSAILSDTGDLNLIGGIFASNLPTPVGDVVGPVGANSGRLAIYNGGSGKVIQDTSGIAALSGGFTGVTSINAFQPSSSGTSAVHWVTDSSFTLIPNFNYLNWGQTASRVFSSYSTDILTVAASSTGLATFVLPIARAVPFLFDHQCTGVVFLGGVASTVVGYFNAVVGTTDTVQLSLVNNAVTDQTGVLYGTLIYTLVP